MARTAAMKRYSVRLTWLCLLYAVFLIAALYAFRHDLLDGIAAYAAAILPALPIIGIFVAMGRYLVEEQDEFIRSLMVRQSLWANAFALSIATVWGFLESFGLAGHVEAFYIAVIWFLGLGIGGLVNRFQYGPTGNCP